MESETGAGAKGQGDAEWTLEERLIQLFTAEQIPAGAHVIPHGFKAAGPGALAHTGGLGHASTCTSAAF